jgi:hypothetical protein
MDRRSSSLTLKHLRSKYWREDRTLEWFGFHGCQSADEYLWLRSLLAAEDDSDALTPLDDVA